MAIPWHDRKRLERLWTEDDARPFDRERIHDAWKRLFKQPLPSNSEAQDTIDLGDCFLYLYDNHVAEYSCEGEAIYLLNPDDGSGALVTQGQTTGTVGPFKETPKATTSGLSNDQNAALDALFEAIARG